MTTLVEPKELLVGDPILIQQLRQSLLSGATVTELAVQVYDYFGMEQEAGLYVSLMPVILYFRDAFGLSLRETRELGLWKHYLAGTYDANWVQQQIMPHIRDKMHLWHKQVSI